MFRKVHLQLTLLFSVISSLILVIMSISYLFVAEKGLKNNSFFSFQRDMNTILANLEQMDVISYEWLLKIEDNGKYSMALYDGFRPLSFGSVTKTGGELALLQEASDYYDSLYPASLAENTGSLDTVHREFAFKDSGKQENYASVSYLKKKNGILKVLVLYPMGFLEGEIAKQRERFLVIIVTAILAVICFSWYFTKKLLKPIEENQRKQLQFVASASHELRTPLAVMLSSLTAMKKANGLEKETFAQIIEEEGLQMSRLIGDMLSLASADTHSFSIQKEAVELDTLLLNCYEAFTPMSHERGIDLSAELPRGMVPPCLCDPSRIEQVVSILLHNAMSYTGAGGIVTLSLFQKDGTLCLQVADNGAGIPDKEKEHIFERFYRADTARKGDGHFGLGLCIAKEIVDAHKGTLAVSDASGGGSVFTVVLPV